MGLVDDIKKSVKGEYAEDDNSAESLVIEHALNRLFYAPPKYKEELQWLKMKYQQAQQQGDRYGLHASAILASKEEFCYREQVLSLFYKQAQGENVPIQRKRIYEEGNYVGEKWQRLFLRGGLSIAEDLDISHFVKKYDLSYTPDIGSAIINRSDYLVELKSQNTMIFRKQKSHPKGMKQLKFYMYSRKQEQPKWDPKGFVLVEDKNCQEFKILLAKYDESEMEPYIERLENIQMYKRRLIEDKKMVPGICKNATCKRATECNMRDACFNIGMGRIKLCIT